MVRRLRLGPASLCPIRSDSNAISVLKGNTGRRDSMCHHDLCTKWFLSTRLETRTKESNIYASIWVENPDA